jgi:hypothetical protein
MLTLDSLIPDETRLFARRHGKNAQNLRFLASSAPPCLLVMTKGRNPEAGPEPPTSKPAATTTGPPTAVNRA